MGVGLLFFCIILSLSLSPHVSLSQGLLDVFDPPLIRLTRLVACISVCLFFIHWLWLLSNIWPLQITLWWNSRWTTTWNTIASPHRVKTTSLCQERLSPCSVSENITISVLSNTQNRPLISWILVKKIVTSLSVNAAQYSCSDSTHGKLSSREILVIGQ